MLDRRTEGFPLFPLGIVALPTESVPLHVFEDRYKRMIEECLREEREFGIVWLSEDVSQPVGCACEIERVMERDEEGNMDILARGTRPFRLLERQEDYPYPAGVVEPLATLRKPNPDRTDRARAVCRAGGAGDRQAPERGGAGGARRLCHGGHRRVGLDGKQELLELRSENARMRLLARLFKAAIKRLELVDRAQARARSNGKVRFG